LIEAIAYAGLKVGILRELAYYSATYTVYCSAKLYVDTRLHAVVIRTFEQNEVEEYARYMKNPHYQ